MVGRKGATKWQRCCWEKTAGIEPWSDGNSLPITGSPQTEPEAPAPTVPPVVRGFSLTSEFD